MIGVFAIRCGIPEASYLKDRVVVVVGEDNSNYWIMEISGADDFPWHNSDDGMMAFVGTAMEPESNTPIMLAIEISLVAFQRMRALALSIVQAAAAPAPTQSN